MIRRSIIYIIMASTACAAPITFNYDQISQGLQTGLAGSNNLARISSLNAWSGGLQEADWTLGLACVALQDFQQTTDDALSALESAPSAPAFKISFLNEQVGIVPRGDSTVDLSPWVGTNSALVFLRTHYQSAVSFYNPGVPVPMDDFDVRMWTQGTSRPFWGAEVGYFSDPPQPDGTSNYTIPFITSYIVLTDTSGKISANSTESYAAVGDPLTLFLEAYIVLRDVIYLTP